MSARARAIAIVGAVAGSIAVAIVVVLVVWRAARPAPRSLVVVTLAGDGASPGALESSLQLVEHDVARGAHHDIVGLVGPDEACLAIDVDPRDDVLTAVDRVRSSIRPAALDPSLSPPTVTAVHPTDDVHVAVTSQTHTLVETRRAALRVATALLMTPGISDVEACGGADEEISVRLDAAKAAALGLGLVDVEEALSKAALPLRLGAQPRSIEEIAKAPLPSKTGAPVAVRDVADVARSPTTPSCVAFDEAGRAVAVLTIRLRAAAGSSAAKARAAAARTVADAAKTLPSGLRVETIDLTPEERERTAIVDLDPAGRDVARSIDRLRVSAVARAWIVGRRAGASCAAVDAPAATAMLRLERGADATSIGRELAAAPTPGVVVHAVSRLDDPPPGARVWIAASSYEDAARIADAVVASTRRVPGVVEAATPPRGGPEIVVVPDRARAARLGVRPADVAAAVRAALHGVTVASLREGDGVIPVVLHLAGASDDPRSLDAVALVGGGGSVVRLTEVATLRIDPPAPRRIRRNLFPAAVVRVRAKDASALRAARDRIAKDVALPAGAALTFDLGPR
jgi:multidrug efflux pump subunit AcrB